MGVPVKFDAVELCKEFRLHKMIQTSWNTTLPTTLSSIFGFTQSQNLLKCSHQIFQAGEFREIT